MKITVNRSSVFKKKVVEVVLIYSSVLISAVQQIESDYIHRLLRLSNKNLPAMQEMWVQYVHGEDPLEKEMAKPTLVFLSGKSHEQRSLAG